MTCSFIRSITNTGHQILTLKSPTNSVVNTPRLPPRSRQFDISITLMSNKALCALFDDVGPVGRSDSHPKNINTLGHLSKLSSYLQRTHERNIDRVEAKRFLRQ